MKKCLLCCAVAFSLAFSLVACANGSGGGKRAVTNSQGSDTNANDGETVIPLESVSKNFLSGDAVTINGSTVTFKGGVDSGILFDEKVVAIEFKLPEGQTSPLALSYLASDKQDDGHADIIGFLINRKIGLTFPDDPAKLPTYDGWDVSNKTNASHNQSIRSGGYGYLDKEAANGHWTDDSKYYYIETNGDMVKFNDAIFGCGNGYKVKVQLDDSENRIHVTNLDNGATWTSKITYNKILEQNQTPLTKRLAISRGAWADSDKTLTLTEVKVYLK